MVPVHKASLVDPATHSPALLELVDQKINRAVIEYLIDAVVETVDFALGRPSHSKRGRSLSRHSEGSSFATVVQNVVARAEVEMPVVLATLAYLDRAKPHLHIALEEWANERVFLGALIVASKYLNDSSLKNVHWAMCTGVFGKRDIGRIEREFLDVLDWDLSITEADVLAHHAELSPLLPALHHVALTPPSSSSSSSSSTASSPLPALHFSPSPSGSSPASSAASFSPRTPHTLVDEPMHPPIDVKHTQHLPAHHHHHHGHHRHPSTSSSSSPADAHRPHPHAVSVSVAPPPPVHAKPPTRSSAHSTFRLLRNFPFPRAHSHHCAPQQSHVVA
ncbi:hypothetical protein OF83DRAFT_1179929 [Amylostereum chailletii]|nr:hypothetical protein OF83DRAFT_1179929 [Amylostereum chailletii]